MVTMKSTQTILRLEAENFKRLSAVAITPDGSTVIIGGKNEQGKSSCLDAIEAALGGGRHLPGEPIRRGAKKAHVVLETETMIVRRKFTAKGSSLEVKAKGGGVFGSPQTMLDDLVGSLSFDPSAFARKDGREQADILRQIGNLDFTDHDARRKAKFTERTGLNRDLKKTQAQVDEAPHHPDAPADEIAVADLAADLERRRSVNAANAKQREALGQHREAAIRAKEEFERLNIEGRALAAKVAELVDEDTDEIRARIETAETDNRKARENAAHARLVIELDRLADESQQITKYLEQMDGTKAETIAAAEFPIPGLAVVDDGVTLDGLPFDQASQAQRLQTSVAIGLALNPELKILLIRDGSYLDDDHLADVARMAEEAGAQIWIERVGDANECTVVIEDGTIRDEAKGAA